MMMPKVFAVAVQKKLFSFPCPQKPQFPLVEKEIAKKNSLRNNCIQLLSKGLHRNYALYIVSWKSEMNLNMTVIVIMRKLLSLWILFGEMSSDHGLWTFSINPFVANLNSLKAVQTWFTWFIFDSQKTDLWSTILSQACYSPMFMSLWAANHFRLSISQPNLP